MLSNATAQAAIQELLHYDRVSGHLYWRVKRGRVAAGQRAGCLSPDGYRRMGLTINRWRDVYLEHLVVWVLETGRTPGPGMVVDHINGVKDDNRWENLREITFAQNVGRAAFPLKAAGRTLPRNVTFDKRRGTYCVQIGRPPSRRTRSGLSLEDATALALEWREELYPDSL